MSIKSLAVLLSVQAASANLAPLISEFQPNPPGTDASTQEVEISGEPGTSFSGWFVSIESDRDLPMVGVVEHASEVTGYFNSDGLVVMRVSDIANPSHTVILCSEFNGAVGISNVDKDKNGIVDDGVAQELFGTVYDALGVPDHDGDDHNLYGSQLGGEDFLCTGTDPALVFRSESRGAWFAINDPPNNHVFDIKVNDVTPAAFSTNPIVAGRGVMTPNVKNPRFDGVPPTPAPPHLAAWTGSIGSVPSEIEHGPLISEFQPNPLGVDEGLVTIELCGVAGQSFSGWILGIEGDESNPGLIDRASEVSGTFDANGILLVTVPDLENPSHTIVLVSSFSGEKGVTDIDTNNDGVGESLSTLGSVYDAIGVPDSTTDENYLYGKQLVEHGVDLKFTGAEPILIFRSQSVGTPFALNGPNVTTVHGPNDLNLTGDAFNVNPIRLGASFGSVNPKWVSEPISPGTAAAPGGGGSSDEVSQAAAVPALATLVIGGLAAWALA